MPPSRINADRLPDEARLRVFRVDLEVTADHPLWTILVQRIPEWPGRLSSMIPAPGYPPRRLPHAAAVRFPARHRLLRRLQAVGQQHLRRHRRADRRGHRADRRAVAAPSQSQPDGADLGRAGAGVRRPDARDPRQAVHPVESDDRELAVRGRVPGEPFLRRPADHRSGSWARTCSWSARSGCG